MDKVTEISLEFSRVVRRELADHVDEIVAKNRLEVDEYVCHTHDYCDANMLMFEAWTKVMGREPDVGDEGDASLWTEAWSKSYHKKFSIE